MCTFNSKMNTIILTYVFEVIDLEYIIITIFIQNVINCIQTQTGTILQ